MVAAHTPRSSSAPGHNSVVASKVTPALEHESPQYRALYYRYVTGFLGPDGSKPDAAESSQLDDEIAYIFPSDAGLTCVAVSVNLETFRCTCAVGARAGHSSAMPPCIKIPGAVSASTWPVCSPRSSPMRTVRFAADLSKLEG